MYLQITPKPRNSFFRREAYKFGSKRFRPASPRHYHNGRLILQEFISNAAINIHFTENIVDKFRWLIIRGWRNVDFVEKLPKEWTLRSPDGLVKYPEKTSRTLRIRGKCYKVPSNSCRFVVKSIQARPRRRRTISCLQGNNRGNFATYEYSELFNETWHVSRNCNPLALHNADMRCESWMRRDTVPRMIKDKN